MATLMTARLLLRPLAMADADALVREVGKIEIARHLARVPHPYEKAHATDFIAWAGTLDQKSAICAVEQNSSPGALIGCISYEWNVAAQDAELGYWFGTSSWGKGFATEAAHALVAHAIEQAKHRRLVASFHDDNPASGRVLSKIGFEPLGPAISYSRAQQREIPATRMLLTRARWKDVRAQKTRLT